MPRLLRIFHSNFVSVYTVSEAESGTPAFHARIDDWGSRTPLITLRAGAGDSGPVLAVCHDTDLSRCFKIGVGDPTSDTGEAAMRWEDLRAQNKSCTEYGWSAATTVNRDVGAEQTGLVWKHTRRVVVDGEAASALRAQGWKLVDQAGTVVAVFTGAKGMKESMTQAGALQINVEWGEEFDAMVVITCLTLVKREL
ncbi:hypothetical protein HJFPF1_02055 [Paramyrothecium foliicola]|nr:hypothetical protein HJFPF1_02055 [Paramyrothecium foliicola]